jgi:hypothetical protein
MNTEPREYRKRADCIRRYNHCWTRNLKVRAAYWSRRAQYWTERWISQMTINEQLSLAA